MGLFRRQQQRSEPHAVTEHVELVGGPSDGTVVPVQQDQDCPISELHWPHRYGVSCYMRRGTPACAVVVYQGGEFRLESRFDYAGDL